MPLLSLRRVPRQETLISSSAAAGIGGCAWPLTLRDTPQTKHTGVGRPIRSSASREEPTRTGREEQKLDVRIRSGAFNSTRDWNSRRPRSGDSGKTYTTSGPDRGRGSLPAHRTTRRCCQKGVEEKVVGRDNSAVIMATAWDLNTALCRASCSALLPRMVSRIRRSRRPGRNHVERGAQTEEPSKQKHAYGTLSWLPINK